MLLSQVKGGKATMLIWIDECVFSNVDNCDTFGPHIYLNGRNLTPIQYLEYVCTDTAHPSRLNVAQAYLVENFLLNN